MAWVNEQNNSRHPRGYFGICMVNPKNNVNVACVIRTASIFGAQFLAVIGERYHKNRASVGHCQRLPVLHFDDVESFLKAMPLNTHYCALELNGRAKSIEQYVHRERCVYILGPEDGSVPGSLLKWDVVKLPGETSMNVSNAAALIMYDRHIQISKVLE